MFELVFVPSPGLGARAELVDSISEFVFAAPEQCRGTNINTSAGSVNKQAFGDNKDISFDERVPCWLGIFKGIFMSGKKKLLLNKKVTLNTNTNVLL